MTNWEELLARLSFMGVETGAGKITKEVVKYFFPTPLDAVAPAAGKAMEFLVKQSINRTIGRGVRVSPYCRAAGDFLDRGEYDAAIIELRGRPDIT